jgi:membrane protein YdbS with pleckstrin-like domain
MQISALRSQRLELATDGSSTLKWAIVLLLGVVTQVALGLVHLDRPRPQLAAVAVFSAAAVVALGLISMQEWPFSGVVQISAVPMHDALKVISGS